MESHAGAGGTFTTVMEVGDSEQLPRSIPSETLKGLRVLIADDNLASREILRDIFASWSMRVDVVASGKEVLAALAAAPASSLPDIVVMDWRMPGMDGLETARAMRADNRTAGAPPVLIVSAYPPDQQMAEAEADGVVAFLLKPIDPTNLLKIIPVLLGADRPYAAASDGAPGSVAMVAPHLRGSHVLLVEDDEINRDIAVNLLTDAGLVVEVASNGRVACDRVLGSSERYDAVLMDVRMPETVEMEATIRIRRDWPSDRLPIIAMTARAYDTDRQRRLDVGMNDHLPKPVDRVLLVRMLDRWLKSRPRQPVSAPLFAALPAPDDALPLSLPPFDLDAALARMNGRRARLRKMIIQFGDTYAVAASTLREQIAGGSLDEARGLAHALKGVAGAIEIGSVAEAARLIEDALTGGEVGEMPLLLDRLEHAILPALVASAALKRLAPAAATVAPFQRAGPAPMIAEMRRLLQRRSLSARKTLEKLEHELALTPEESVQNPVRIALDRLDYGEALTALGRITTRDAVALRDASPERILS